MIRLKAYAKINLGLRILRKREDGYHNIETVFTRVNPFDEIVCTPSSTIAISCSEASLPVDENNLCVRAAQTLQKQCGTHRGVHLSLSKNIPIGAGLGGGSSDAAATLLGLLQYWSISLSREQLNTLALNLGSDVPFFLKEGCAFAKGRGEVLEYFDLRLPYWILVVYPNCHISTAWAYQHVHPKRRRSEMNLKELLSENINRPEKLRKLLKNDFESIVFKNHAEVGALKESLYDTGAVFALLSGSGSAVYGFYESEKLSRNAAEKFGKQYPAFITPPNI